MRETKVTKNLECDLTEDELREFGLKMAVNLGEIAKAETQKKDSANVFKAQIDELSSDQRHLSRCIVSKTESRDVDCKIVYRFKDVEKDIVRLDTGELVETKPITASEQQENIDLKDSKKASS